MIATPRLHTWCDPHELHVVPSDSNTLVIECEVSQPPSLKGRTVYVVFEGEEVTALLREVRTTAIAQRALPLPS